MSEDRRAFKETKTKPEIERMAEVYFTFLYDIYFSTPCRYWIMMFDKMFEKGNITYLE